LGGNPQSLKVLKMTNLDPDRRNPDGAQRRSSVPADRSGLPIGLVIAAIALVVGGIMYFMLNNSHDRQVTQNNTTPPVITEAPAPGMAPSTTSSESQSRPTAPVAPATNP
jgi:hypothetical protein